MTTSNINPQEFPNVSRKLSSVKERLLTTLNILTEVAGETPTSSDKSETPLGSQLQEIFYLLDEILSLIVVIEEKAGYISKSL